MEKISRLIKNCGLLLAIVFLLDRGLGGILEYYFQTEQRGDDAKTMYALTRAQEDIVIFGSSRAAHHYVSEEVKQLTGLSCFNAGRDGMKMSYYKLLLDAMLSYHEPKIIILDLNYNDLFREARKDEDIFISSLLPYINENKVINQYVFKNAPKEGWKARVSKLYQFNSKPASILHHKMGIGQKHYDGYEPLKGNKLEDGYKVHINTTSYTEDPELVKEFEAFVKEVKSRGIDLYIIYSPRLAKVQYDYSETAERISARYNVPLLNYSQFYSLQDKHLFYDKTHLNHEGAERFTQKVLNQILNEKGKAPKKKTRVLMKPIPVNFQSDKETRNSQSRN